MLRVLPELVPTTTVIRIGIKGANIARSYFAMRTSLSIRVAVHSENRKALLPGRAFQNSLGAIQE
jgi:hypothetical protein